MTTIVGGRIRSVKDRTGAVALCFALLAGALVLLVGPPVSAITPPGPVPLIEVDAAYTTDGPFVRCAWVLPDADKRAGTGMQYGIDDLREEKPSEGPCAATGLITASGNRHLAQVVSNPADLPTKRLVELWAAVEHGQGVSGVSGVTFRVFYPDGNFKAEIAGKVVPTGECTSLGSSGEGSNPSEGSMFGAAASTGQVTTGFAGTLATRCGARALGLYRALIDISQNEPCGEYRYEVHAVGGSKMISVHQFDVYCSAQMAIDLDRIGWGALTPGTTKWAFGGDLSREGIPKVINRGSAGIEVGIRFSAMRPSTGSGSAITEFGATFKPAGRPAVTLGDISAGDVAWFGPSAALCADESAAMDAAVHPPVGLGEGTYVGSIEVMIRQVAYEAGCNNDLGYWSGPDAISQRVGYQGTSGPKPSDPLLPPPSDESSTTTTTSATSTTVVAGGGPTTTQPPGGGATTTTIPPSTTTTSPPDPTAGYPIPYITVTATFEGSEISALDYTATIQPGVTIGSDAFDLTACWPLLHIDGNGDGYNDGDANRNRAMNPGEGWVFSCGFGQQPNPPVQLPFDPALLLNP